MANTVHPASLTILSAELRQKIIRYATALTLPNANANRLVLEKALKANKERFRTIIALRATCRLIYDDVQMVQRLNSDEARVALVEKYPICVCDFDRNPVVHFQTPHGTVRISARLESCPHGGDGDDLSCRAYTKFQEGLVYEVDYLSCVQALWEKGATAMAKAREN